MEKTPFADDNRISRYIEAAEKLAGGDFKIEFPVLPEDEIGLLGKALLKLAQSLETRYWELNRLNQITRDINAGLLLDEILERVYEGFRDLIPYNRIGFSVIEAGGTRVRAHWAKSDQPNVSLGRGYTAALEGSSLQTILKTGQPRIINDLVEYARNKPYSESTQLMLQEGIRSSLTCPLIANGIPVGFMFFSSIHPHTYQDSHLELFQQIAGQLSIILEKGRLMTEIMEQKAEIEAQNESLRALNEMKNTFLGIAVHDLRSPLGTISLGIDVLTFPSIVNSDEERLHILNDIRAQTDYMLTLLNDILDITDIESGHLRIELAPLNLTELLQATAGRWSKLAEAKQTVVHFHVSPKAYAMADPLRLRQVLDNLISNAVKFSPVGTTVSLKIRAQDDYWRVEIEDQGPGIRPEEQPLLFGDFVRLSNRPTAGEHSTGLGLAITHRLVTAMGGKIGVISDGSNGSIFWFTLPACPATNANGKRDE